MFTAHCPRHGSDVLLSETRILAIDNSGDRMRVSWVCWCGHVGSHHTGRRRPLTDIL